MKKKLLALTMALAMTAGALSACAGTATSPAADAAPAEEAAEATEETAEAPAEEEANTDLGGVSEDPNTLTVAAWDANFNIPALQAAETAYKTKNPDFKPEINTVSGSQDVENAVTNAASAGDYSTLPDIVLFQDHYIQQYVANYPDAWQSLEGATIDWSDFGAEKLSYSTIDGKHYGAPVDNGTAIFAYRTDILEECGYTIDDVTGITWDRWLEIGREVKEKTGKYLLSMDHSGDDLPYMFMQAEGLSQWKDGKPDIAGNETYQKILQVIVDGANDGVILLCNSWSEYTDESIVGDQVAGVMNGNWIIPTIKQVAENSGKWALTTIPTLSGKEGYAANGGSSLYVTANCAKLDLAQDFLAYTFGGGEGAMETYDNALKNGGVITCCISAGKSSVYQEPDEYFNGQAIYADIVAMGANVPVVEQNDFHYNLRTAVGTAITNATTAGGGADLAAEIQAASDDIDRQMSL
ncbi:MAG: sugar ABC transporter substrate-binding protein [Lachnospiraceae bacterium]|nr:sugar ABC transporter substrate-binding protein [Lachnospiraceae bacterium]